MPSKALREQGLQGAPSRYSVYGLPEGVYRLQGRAAMYLDVTLDPLEEQAARVLGWTLEPRGGDVLDLRCARWVTWPFGSHVGTVHRDGQWYLRTREGLEQCDLSGSTGGLRAAVRAALEAAVDRATGTTWHQLGGRPQCYRRVAVTGAGARGVAEVLQLGGGEWRATWYDSTHQVLREAGALSLPDARTMADLSLWTPAASV